MSEKKADAQAASNEKASSSDGEQHFGIQRIYVKDLSFESPSAPKSFLEEYAPEVKVDLQTNQSSLDDKHVNVVVHLTVTAEQKGKTVFLVEVQQAGVFALEGFDEVAMAQILSVVCPNVLFPYARETISDMVVKGGFPPLYLAPVNFEAMYAEKVAAMSKEAANDPVTPSDDVAD